jgi:peroxiredoxin family protein
METQFMPEAEVMTEAKPVKKVMIIVSKGTLDGVYPALILANGARMEGIEAEMFFTFFGLEAVVKERMNHLHVAAVGNPALHMPTLVGGLPGMENFVTHMMKKEMEKLDIPDVGEFLEIIQASGGKIFVCKLAMDMFHMKKEDLWEGVDEILTVGDFYARCAGENTQVLFT